MDFRTEIKLAKSQTDINYSDKIITFGSCFAENIGEYFNRYRFNVLPNPFGVLYNPVSIYNAIKRTVKGAQFTPEEIVYNQEEWHSFYFHSDFSTPDKDKLLENINSITNKTLQYLKEASFVVITYGTAFVYRYNETGKIVSNCHKIPAKQFTRELLDMETVTDSISNTVELLNKINPSLKIIFTVSPVRHWKDGAIDNMRSKSILLLAIHEIVSSKENCTYFPSFEIMMDDLRDYRFYENDMLHPSSTAVKYIWEKFGDVFFTSKTREIMTKAFKIDKARMHRVKNKNSDSYKKFVMRTIKQIEELTKVEASINLISDMDYFREELNSYSE